MKEWAEAIMGIGIAACVCALVGFLLMNCRQCDETRMKLNIESEKTAVEMQRAIPSALEACRVACGDHGVHKSGARDCECK